MPVLWSSYCAASVGAVLAATVGWDIDSRWDRQAKRRVEGAS